MMQKRGIREPEMVVGVSAHAAYFKVGAGSERVRGLQAKGAPTGGRGDEYDYGAPRRGGGLAYMARYCPPWVNKNAP